MTTAINAGGVMETHVWEAPTAKTPVRATVLVRPLSHGFNAASVKGEICALTVADAAVFLAAAACTTGTVVIRNWSSIAENPSATILREALASMGAYVVSSKEGLTCTSRSTSGHLSGITIDLADNPDLIAPLLVLSVLADEPSELRGLTAHHKITEPVVANLNRIGGSIEWNGSTARVFPRPLHGGAWVGAGTAASSALGAVLALVVPGIRVYGVEMDSREGRAFLKEWNSALDADEHILPGATRGTVPYYR